MSLTPEHVRHVSLLARLGLTPEEVERFRSQLNSVLENFQVLQEIDTEGVPPTGHAVPLASVWRDDKVAPSLPKEETLRNAPRREDDYLRVRAVLE